TDLGGTPSLRALLARVRKVTLSAFDHQELSFEQIVEDLQPERSLSHSPIFQVLFTLHNTPVVEQKIGDLLISPLEVEHTTSKYDLSLDLGKTEAGELEGFFEYNSDLFEAETIARLARHFTRVLEEMARDIEQPINAFVLLTEDEVQRQTVTWNTVEAPYELNEGYVERFRRQAALTPQAVALVCGTDSLTYRELDRRSNALALRLRARGVGPERLVAVLDQRDLPLAVALLAILKAGGAYLPLDPSQPLSRLRQMIRQSGCAFVLTGEPFAARLQSVLDDFPAGERPAWEVLNATEEAAEGPELPWQGERLAYVIYTSGSTGLPKGVMVEHRGMLNHLLAKVAALDLRPSDCVAQNASQCFDISIWQLLAAWLVGARVHLFPDQQAHQPAELLAEVQRGGVTVLELVPSLLRALLDLLEQRQVAPPAALRWLIATGEALPADLCQRWLALAPQIPLLNAYGPTECSDDVTHMEITQADELSGPVAPLGYPLPNTRLYVLDAAQQLVPVGVSGELWVGGVGVGRGYLNDSRRTAEAFRPDPFGAPGQRLYRTGDLVRARPDGQMEFLGRIDQQVKLRGYRIELGEIEAALRKHPSVRDCLVILRESETHNARLLAYVVPHSEAAVSPADLSAHLKNMLPEYMLPAGYLLLDALPLTANGKVDRKALPEPEYQFAQEDTPYVAPSTPTEQTLAAIWSSVLEYPRVGIHDDFFLLGGHSLLAIRLMSQIEQQFARHLPLEMIFQWRTIAELASVLDRVTAQSAWETTSDPAWEELNLYTEATLATSDCPEVWPQDLASEPTTILLTGATSFLG
ncbi:MAG TPA: amino acid adenylation domain-containing protein, partial [Acidobacteriaceae bacterium]|nr:amino acid adenylation domain-containing protein [Acidobacteriaceae bacterium]